MSPISFMREIERERTTVIITFRRHHFEYLLLYGPFVRDHKVRIKDNFAKAPVKFWNVRCVGPWLDASQECMFSAVQHPIVIWTKWLNASKAFEGNVSINVYSWRFHCYVRAEVIDLYVMKKKKIYIYIYIYINIYKCVFFINLGCQFIDDHGQFWLVLLHDADTINQLAHSFVKALNSSTDGINSAYKKNGRN